MDIKYSARHNGLSLYLGRLLKAIWKESILTRIPADPNSESSKGTILDSSISISSLLESKENLESLNKFLDSNKFFTAIPSSESDLNRYGQVANRAEDDAQRAEQQSLFNIHSLLQQAIEAIQFVLLLIDHDVDGLVESYEFSSIIASRLPKTIRKEFAALTYENLVITENGREIAKLLIDILINKQVFN
jgi:nuclear pore complex protein Nup155